MDVEAFRDRDRSRGVSSPLAFVSGSRRSAAIPALDGAPTRFFDRPNAGFPPASETVPPLLFALRVLRAGAGPSPTWMDRPFLLFGDVRRGPCRTAGRVARGSNPRERSLVFCVENDPRGHEQPDPEQESHCFFPSLYLPDQTIPFAKARNGWGEKRSLSYLRRKPPRQSGRSAGPPRPRGRIASLARRPSATLRNEFGWIAPNPGPLPHAGFRSECALPKLLFKLFEWSGREDSNLRPPVPQTDFRRIPTFHRRSSLLITSLLATTKTPLVRAAAAQKAGSAPRWRCPRRIKSGPSSSSRLPVSDGPTSRSCAIWSSSDPGGQAGARGSAGDGGQALTHLREFGLVTPAAASTRRLSPRSTHAR